MLKISRISDSESIPGIRINRKEETLAKDEESSSGHFNRWILLDDNYLLWTEQEKRAQKIASKIILNYFCN